MHRAKSFPQDHFRVFNLFFAESTHRHVIVPDHHFLEWDSHLVTGIAAQVLIREKQNLFTPFERPVENVLSIGRGTDNTAVLTTKSFQIGRRVDVGDWSDAFVRVEDRIQLTPGALYLLEIRHVGHRATSRQIRQDGDLFRPRNNVGHFSHEVHATKNNIFGFGIGRLARQFQRVTREISVFEYFIALVVMAENDDSITEYLPRALDTHFTILIVQRRIRLQVNSCSGHGYSES